MPGLTHLIERNGAESVCGLRVVYFDPQAPIAAWTKDIFTGVVQRAYQSTTETGFVPLWFVRVTNVSHRHKKGYQDTYGIPADLVWQAGGH